jgi:hypothetical protein
MGRDAVVLFLGVVDVGKVLLLLRMVLGDVVLLL